MILSMVHRFTLIVLKMAVICSPDMLESGWTLSARGTDDFSIYLVPLLDKGGFECINTSVSISAGSDITDGLH